MARQEHDAELSRYIERVRAVPALTREQEQRIARRGARGDKRALDELVEANLRFAVAVALQYRGYGLPLAELIAEGNLGLVIAAKKFDATKGTRFVTYAGYWIRAFVLDYVVHQVSLVGGGTGALRTKLFFRLRRERARVANLSNDPEQREKLLAERLNTTPERVAAMTRRLDAKDVSLDAPLYHDPNATLLDTVGARAPEQETDLLESERREALHARLADALAQLDRRERFIVERRIMSDEELSLAAIGRTLGVSRERARQLEARAKKKLRLQLADPEWRDAVGF